MGHKHKHRSKHPKMTPLEELDMLSSSEPPINPVDGYAELDVKGKFSKNKQYDGTKGWKYYHTVRESLPEWWEEFNGSLDKYGRLKYATIREFIKTKAHKNEEIKFLYAMIGPVHRRTEVDKGVPWLGDWEKRRRNGYGLLDSPEKVKPLLKVIRENLAAADSIRALAPFLAEELVQYSALEKQVHEAFAGKAFLRSREAHDKKNISRFDVYRKMLAALTEMKVRVIHELMRVYGVDPDTPQQMREMVQMAGGIGAAAALTGIAAGQQIPGLGQSVPVPGGTGIAPYTYDAFKLAEHLTKHAHTFKKPLPTTLDADPSSFEEEEDASKHKGNGKVV